MTEPHDTPLRHPLHRRVAKRLHLTFIPHPQNNHQPHALRLPALRIYSVALILAKIATTGLLFLAYPSQGTFSTLTAGRMVQLVNDSRAGSGVPALVTNAALAGAATAKANDLIAKQYFAHTNPDGKQFFQWIRDAGYTYSLAGENLAKDFSSAEAAHNALMASELHRKNILNEKFRDVGIAVVAGTVDGRDSYVLVELFGAPPAVKPTPRVAAAPAPQRTPQPTPEPTPAPTLPSPAPPAQTYVAALVEQSHGDLALTAGQAVAVRLAFQNVGTATWSEPLQLRALPPETGSGFPDTTWETSEIVTTPNETSVLPGDVAHLIFTLRAGSVEEDTRQSFLLVVSDTPVTDSSVTFAGTITSPELTAANPEPTAVRAPAEVITAGALSEEPTTRTFFAGMIARNPDLPFWAFLSFISLALAVDILVRIRHQHPRLVFHVLLVIVLTGALMVTNIHFLERVATDLVIR